MTTLFLDYEGGNNNHGGTSFATLASGTDGRLTAGGVASSATASFPNDGSLIGQYFSIFNGAGAHSVYNITGWISGTSLQVAQISGGTVVAAQIVDRQYYIGGRWKTLTTGATAARIVPGDTLRLMGSPAPTSLGAATWTGGVSYTGSASEKAIQSSTNASPIVVTSASHGLVTGDTVEIAGHTTNTFANGMWEVTYLTDNTYSLDGSTGNGVGGATGTGRRMTTCRVMLDTACTQKIAGCSLQEGAWTQSANVTATVLTTDYMGKYGSASIAIADAFGTGLAAYFATGTLDLSGYQQVTFWIKQTAGTLGAAGATTISLCSDVAGATPVNTVNVPQLAALNIWYPVTVDTAGALGASIKSVGLNVVTDNAAQTFLIGSVVAAKASSSADSLTYTSIIGKNTATETWFAIRSIEGTRVVLSSYVATQTNTRYNAYDGTSENVTTYKRETIKTTVAATVPHVATEGGTSAAPFVLSGGWDRTNMSTQSGETWYSQGTFSTATSSAVIVSLAQNFWNADKIHAAFCFSSYVVAGSKCNIGTLHSVHHSINGIQITGKALTIDSLFAPGCAAILLATAAPDLTIDALRTTGNSVGLSLTGAPRFALSNFSIRYSANDWLRQNGSTQGMTLKSGTVEYTATALLNNWGIDEQAYYAEDCTFNLTSGVNHYPGPITYSRGYATTKNENGNGLCKIYGAAGSVIIQDTTQVHGSATSSWKMSPVSTTIIEDWPLYLPFAKIALEANIAQAISFWMRRSNTGLTMRLMCKGGQIAGHSTDVSTDMTAAADTWEQVTITLTPTETGVVELEAHAFGGATYNGWVGEMELS